MRRVILAIGMCLVASLANAAEPGAEWQRLVTAAKKEGKVVIGVPPGSDFRIEAQAALKKFQAEFPTWNSKIVNFRLNYLASKISPLQSAAGGEPAARVRSWRRPARWARG